MGVLAVVAAVSGKVLMGAYALRNAANKRIKENEQRIAQCEQELKTCQTLWSDAKALRLECERNVRTAVTEKEKKRWVKKSQSLLDIEQRNEKAVKRIAQQLEELKKDGA